jgi:hypothetical protein
VFGGDDAVVDGALQAALLQNFRQPQNMRPRSAQQILLAVSVRILQQSLQRYPFR